MPFAWRRGAPPDLLQARLSRALDPTLDPRTLVLIDAEGEECDLCDVLENNTAVTARFLEIRMASLPSSVSPAILAEVVGVKKPISNRNRSGRTLKRHGGESLTTAQKEGYLILRKLVRKAVKQSRFLNGTGHFGVYVSAPRAAAPPPLQTLTEHPHCC